MDVCGVDMEAVVWAGLVDGIVNVDVRVLATVAPRVATPVVSLLVMGIYDVTRVVDDIVSFTVVCANVIGDIVGTAVLFLLCLIPS